MPQSLAPEYAKAALRLAETHPSVVLAKVDATEESELAERFGVDGFPTLKWVTAEGEVDYNGGRTECVYFTWHAAVLVHLPTFCHAHAKLLQRCNCEVGHEDDRACNEGHHNSRRIEES